MTAWLLPLLAGGVTGVLSAFGIGGGSLLLIYLTSFAAWTSTRPRGSICSISCRLPPLPCLLTRRMDYWSKDHSPGCGDGLSSCWAHGLVVHALDTSVLRKLFGLFLLYIGLTELFRKDKPTQDTKDSTPAPKRKADWHIKASPLF